MDGAKTAPDAFVDDAGKGTLKMVVGLVILFLSMVVLTAGFTGAAAATIYVASPPEGAANADGEGADGQEVIDDEDNPLYSGEVVVIEDDEVPMYSGKPGDPANLLRIGIIGGILAVVGFYLLFTGRLNRSINVMKHRI